MSEEKTGIRVGAVYSNGNFGNHWAVRQVLARNVDCPAVGAADCIRYKVLVGPGRRNQGICSAEEFLRWARYEVVRDENSWVQVGAVRRC
jgi:CBS domain-containing membrane protein